MLREQRVNARVQQRVGKIIKTQAVDALAAHVECRRSLRVADDLRTSKLHGIRNDRESRVVGELDLVEAEAEGVRRDGHLACLCVEVERSWVKRAPGSWQGKSSHHVVTELIARAHAFAAARN